MLFTMKLQTDWSLDLATVLSDIADDVAHGEHTGVIEFRDDVVGSWDLVE